MKKILALVMVLALALMVEASFASAAHRGHWSAIQGGTSFVAVHHENPRFGPQTPAQNALVGGQFNTMSPYFLGLRSGVIPYKAPLTIQDRRGISSHFYPQVKISGHYGNPHYTRIGGNFGLRGVSGFGRGGAIHGGVRVHGGALGS